MVMRILVTPKVLVLTRLGRRKCVKRKVLATV